MAQCMSHSLARPFLAPRPAISTRTMRKPLRARMMTRSAINAYQVAEVVEQTATKVGDVAAPSWVLPVGVVVVTLGSILSGYLLKPGTDASIEMQKRDAKKGSKFGNDF